MGNTWVIDIRHYLDDEGHLAIQSGPARKLAEYVCEIILTDVEVAVFLGEEDVDAIWEQGMHEESLAIFWKDASGTGHQTGLQSCPVHEAGHRAAETESRQLWYPDGAR